MDFLRFLISRIFLKNLLVAISIALIILLITLVGLRIYTHHGRAITVPNLTGLTINEVDDVTSSRRLNYLVIDSIFATDMPRGTVVKQNPKPNSKVKVRRRIFVTMNAINPEKVSMPNLIALSDRQAILALENAGLVLGEISYKPDIAVNSVLQQMLHDSVIIEGTMIEKGTSIDLVLGMGASSERTMVPDLEFMNLQEAKAAISAKFLNFGLASYDESVLTADDSIRAWVYRQYPAFDGRSNVNKGDEVFVWMSVDSTLLPVIDTTLIDSNAENEIIF